MGRRHCRSLEAGRALVLLKTLLMIIGHVEACLFQQAPYAIHEGFRPATENFALQEIRRQQFQPCTVDTSVQARPYVAGRGLLDDEGKPHRFHAARKQFQFLAEDDVVRCARTIDEANVSGGRAIEKPACHRHHGRDAGTG
ncbi:hypothetical protein B3286c1_0061 [Brucella vulpis]|nr:hypothetical protein BF3285c1_0063 [Brucella vulpis]CUW48900.1 hypothetical protein B3286c1_0061 [Brucella vulpis]